MLPGPNGQPMLRLALAGIPVDFDNLIVAILREHEEKFGVRSGLASAFGRPIQLAILEQPTRSQSETVACTLRQVGLDEPFLVKDSDGYFHCADLQSEVNYVCVDTLNNFDLINPRNKSYVEVDAEDRIHTMREKVVISDLFNVGGYFFRSPSEFLSYYDKLSGTASTSELYLSNVISAMLADDIPFVARRTQGYQDWGTAHDWRRALLGKQAYLVSLDGFVFERGNRHFKPRFDEVRPNEAAVEAVQQLAAAGNTIVYLSIRPSSLESLTCAQLTAAQLPMGQIVWDCPGAAWQLVTAPHPTLPLQTARASELDPHGPELATLLKPSENP
jgi:hypothetical protein